MSRYAYKFTRDKCSGEMWFSKIHRVKETTKDSRVCTYMHGTTYYEMVRTFRTLAEAKLSMRYEKASTPFYFMSQEELEKTAKTDLDWIMENWSLMAFRRLTGLRVDNYYMWKCYRTFNPRKVARIHFACEILKKKLDDLNKEMVLVLPDEFVRPVKPIY